MKWRLLAVALAAVAAAGAEDEPPLLEGAAREAFLDEVERGMAGVRTVAAAFEQEKTLALLEEPFRTSGVLLFQRPDRLRWEIQVPFRSLLIVAGDEAAKYEFIDGERRRLALGRGAGAVAAVMERIRGWFQGRFDRDGEQYELRARRAPEPTIVLVPKDPALRENLRAIEVRLTARLDAIERVVLEERGGDRTVMTFRLLAQDVPLDPALFSLADPAELDVEALR